MPGTCRLLQAIAIVLILAVAAAVRIRGAINEMWLDEIWSLEFVKHISSPLDVFTSLHHENNHYLNSLCFYYFGQHGNWLGYRLPALGFGLGSVLLAGLIGRRRNTTSGLIALLLTSFSYVLILYSSEARGYAAAIFFSLLSYYLMDHFLENRRWSVALLFSTVAVLGFMSHLIFLNCFLAILLWSGCWFVQTRTILKSAAAAMLACHGMPIIFLIAIYFVDIRHLEVGGGTPTGLQNSYAASLGWTLGIPRADSMTWLTWLVAAGLLGGMAGLLRREKKDAGIFFAGVILLFPILLVLIRHSQILYVRHFIIGITFLLILLSFLLAALYQRGPAGKAVVILLLAGYLALNGWHTRQLFQFGRGHYAAAVRYIVKHSQQTPITIGAIGIEQDFRTPFMLQFHGQPAFGDKPVTYYTKEHWPPGGPEWLIYDADSIPPPHYTTPAGDRYELAEVYPTTPLSGLRWSVYHNQYRQAEEKP